MRPAADPRIGGRPSEIYGAGRPRTWESRPFSNAPDPADLGGAPPRVEADRGEIGIKFPRPPESEPGPTRPTEYALTSSAGDRSRRALPETDPGAPVRKTDHDGAWPGFEEEPPGRTNASENVYFPS